MATAANNEDRIGLQDLPNELLINIISLICDSQSVYRSLRLVSRRLDGIVKFESLTRIPIRLNAYSVRSFWEFLESDPELAGCVRYLWLSGSLELCKAIAGACTNLIALACSKWILYSICEPGVHQHTHLVELTLFDNEACWLYLSRLNQEFGTIELCRQITHLRIHEKLTSDFNGELFPSLTHFSSSGNKIVPFFLLHDLAALGNIPKLEHIVITTFFWADEPADEKTKMIYRMDQRVRIVYFGSEYPGEFTLWCGRARKTECIWTRRTAMQRLL